MHVQVLQENLQRGLSIVGRAVATRSTLPITSNVLIESHEGALRLVATDLDISISTQVGARIDEEGRTTVPARLMTEIVGQLPPAAIDLEVVERGKQVHLHCANNESNLSALDAEDFPNITTVEDGTALELDGNAFRRAIERVEFAAATDDSRPVLTGIHVKADGEQLTLAAADGFRVAIADLALTAPVAEAFEIVVPARALREVSRFIGDSGDPVHVRIDQARTRVAFSVADTDLVAQLLQGTFPNYTQLVPPEYATRTLLDLAEFVRETKIAAVFARDGSGIVRLLADPVEGGTGQLKVTAEAQDVGNHEGTIDATVEGEPARIAFNARYLQDVLGVLGDKVALETSGPSRQGVFRTPDDPTYVHVVMPMFVQW